MPQEEQQQSQPINLGAYLIDVDTDVLLTPEQIQAAIPNTFTCPNCERNNRPIYSSEPVYNRDFIWERWCEDCIDEETFSCDHCSSRHHNDQRCDDYYCEECSSILEEQNRDDDDDDGDYGGLSSYSRRIDIPQKSWPGYDKKIKRYFGVELEVEVQNKYDFRSTLDTTKDRFNTDYFIFKSDGSLNNGFEIVSCPASYEEIPKLWERFLKNPVQGLRSQKSVTCGMHIHVSRKSISPLTLGKMLVFINGERNQNFITLVAGRGPNSYCQRKIKTLKCGKVHSSEDRYELLNVTPATAEFRIFQGTMTYYKFVKNIEFCQALITFCEQTSMKMLAAADFLDWLSKQGRQTYPNLRRFLKEANDNKKG